jgi:D-alanine-D-alanine ligase-like ATP-grasp enzyme
MSEKTPEKIISGRLFADYHQKYTASNRADETVTTSINSNQYKYMKKYIKARI